ncbi:phage major capsid protein [bacterium]|jgi:hypothetical protein|nr:phage major capsid protein [bacterium]
MAFANSAVSDLIATTIEQRSKTLADNLSDNNALLMKMKQRGNSRPFSGGRIIYEELMYPDSSTTNANSYSGYELLNIGVNSPISAAQFDIKQYSAAVTMSGLEMLQNAGEEAFIDLMESRIKIAEADLMNRISTDLYGDGTGNAGKNITGLAAAIDSTPATGTYGGIDRSAWAFWNNIAVDASALSITPGATTIQGLMNRVIVQLVRGTDRPDLIVFDSNLYRHYLESLQANQRFTSDTGSAGAGFTSLKYYGAGGSCDVVLDGGIGGNCPTDTGYFINTKYLHWRPHSARNFKPIGGDRQSVNQDAVVRHIGWAGNLTCSGVQFQGVLVP